MRRRRALAERVRIVAALACVAACMPDAAAQAQAATRESAIAALRDAASAGSVDAQLALASLLDGDGAARNDEALALYEKAARAGSRVAHQRYLDMMARPAPPAAVPLRAFTIRLPKASFGEEGPPPDIPPGYHCHPLGNGVLWCHGGSD